MTLATRKDVLEWCAKHLSYWPDSISAAPDVKNLLPGWKWQCRYRGDGRTVSIVLYDAHNMLEVSRTDVIMKMARHISRWQGREQANE